jgi:hypothetical protein
MMTQMVFHLHHLQRVMVFVCQVHVLLLIFLPASCHQNPLPQSRQDYHHRRHRVVPVCRRHLVVVHRLCLSHRASAPICAHHRQQMDRRLLLGRLRHPLEETTIPSADLNLRPVVHLRLHQRDLQWRLRRLLRDLSVQMRRRRLPREFFRVVMVAILWPGRRRWLERRPYTVPHRRRRRRHQIDLAQYSRLIKV